MSAPSHHPLGDETPPSPRLRLVEARRGERGEEPHRGDPAPYGYDRILVAGSDPAERTRMLAELRSLLPAGTDFREASETWEVIAQSAESQMVVLAGDLGETPASALLRLLARRNPALPVLAVGSDRRLHTPAQGRDPGDGGYRPTAGAAHA